MGMLIQRPQPLWRLRVEVDFDLTPRQAVELLPGSNSDIKLWPEDQMVRWNGGRTGIDVVEFSVLWTKQLFNRDQGRQMLGAASLDPILPVMLASLARPENDPKQMREELNKGEGEGMWGLVVLGENDDDLLRLDDDFWVLYLCLDPSYFCFDLGGRREYLGDYFALPGLPK